jgi:hypothetical protein
VIPKKGKLFPLRYDDNLMITSTDHKILFFLCGPKVMEIWMNYLTFQEKLDYLRACKFAVIRKSKMIYYHLLSKFFLPEVAKTLNSPGIGILGAPKISIKLDDSSIILEKFLNSKHIYNTWDLIFHFRERKFNEWMHQNSKIFS